MFTNDDIVAALAKVMAPDGKTPLTDAAKLGINIRDNKIFLSIAVAPEAAASYEPVADAAEAALKGLKGAAGAAAVVTAERPHGAQAQGQGHGQGHGHGQGQAQQRGPGLDKVKKVLAVASGKGGVGKSTTSANLAIGLARLGLKVGLLDADVFGPSQPRLFGVSGKPELNDQRLLVPFEKFGVKLMSIGFLVGDEQAVVWRGALVMSAINQLLRDVDWGELDVLVVDMPPGTGDVQLTMAQNANLAGAVIVSTPQDLALIDARRGVAMFEQVHVPILGVFENMSYFLCPHCGGRSDVFSHGGARAEAEKLGVPFLGEAPLDLFVRESSDAGKPVLAFAPEAPQAQPYLALAEKIRAELGGEPVKAAPRFVIE